MRCFNKLLLPLLAGFQLMSCSPDLPKDVAAAYKELPDKIDYNLHVKPVLSINAFRAMARIRPNKKPACDWT